MSKVSISFCVQPEIKARLAEIKQKCGYSLSEGLELIIISFLRDNVKDGVVYFSERPPSEEANAWIEVYNYAIKLEEEFPKSPGTRYVMLFSFIKNKHKILNQSRT